MEKFIPIHKQLICKGTCLITPTKEQLDKWMIDLVNKVRMKVLSGPTSIVVDDEPGNNGITSTVVLSTSHACIHFWNEIKPTKFQFDIYSCSEYTVEEVLEQLDLFKFIDLEYMFIDRDNEIIVLDNKKLIKNPDIKNFDEFFNN